MKKRIPQTHTMPHPFQILPATDLTLIAGGAPGSWGIGASLQASATAPMTAGLDLSYHLPNLSVTGSLTSCGRQLEAGLGAQGSLRSNGNWAGTFTSDGHNWNANLQVKIRF